MKLEVKGRGGAYFYDRAFGVDRWGEAPAGGNFHY
jgi:hypothetical protein